MGDDAASSSRDSPLLSPRSPRPAPWRGRKRVPEARKRYVAVRCTETEYATMTAAARKSGLTVGAFLRALGCGDPGLRAARRPPIETQELARLLGHIGKLGSNVNQLAHMANAAGQLRAEHQLDEIGDDVRAMRTAVMKALGRGD